MAYYVLQSNSQYCLLNEFVMAIKSSFGYMNEINVEYYLRLNYSLQPFDVWPIFCCLFCQSRNISLIRAVPFTTFNYFIKNEAKFSIHSPPLPPPVVQINSSSVYLRRRIWPGPCTIYLLHDNCHHKTTSYCTAHCTGSQCRCLRDCPKYELLRE